MRERQGTDLLHPERVRDGPLDLRRGPGDALATAQGFAGIRGELGLDADHGRARGAGPHGRGYPRDQPAAADRHDDQVGLRAVRHDLQADRALPRDDPPVVKRRDQHIAVPRRELGGGREPRLQRGGHGHDLGAVVLDRLGLDPRGRTRHHHDRAHAEQGRGVRHRVTVVAAGMRDHAVLPGGPFARHDRVVGAPQLERSRRLKRLGLDQQGRLEPRETDQRRTDRHRRQQLRRGGYLRQADQLR